MSTKIIYTQTDEAPALATYSLPSPAAKSVKPDESGARWLNVKGPKGEPLRSVRPKGDSTSYMTVPPH